MKVIIEKNCPNTDVNIGDVLVTKGGRKILLVENIVGKVLAINLESNKTTSREYSDIEDFLKSYATDYTVYKSDNIELAIKGIGVGLVWQ